MNYESNKISIIIPVYNVEPYIKKCLDSVINQTYSNLEIICIDDGSADNSGKICDEYALNDKRIKVFHKKNGGVSSARNVGLNNISGDFVGFIDPDDWIEPDMYELLLTEALKSSADISVSSFTKDTDLLSIVMTNTEDVDSEPFNREKLILYAFKRDSFRGFGAYLCTKLFRSSLIKDLKFDENIMVGEDVLFFVQLAVRTDKSIYINKPLYHYLQREASLIHFQNIEKRLGLLSAYLQMIDILKANYISDDVIIWLKRFYVYHASIIAEIAYKQKNFEILLTLQNEIRRYLNEYIETNKFYPDRIARINSILNLKDIS